MNITSPPHSIADLDLASLPLQAAGGLSAHLSNLLVIIGMDRPDVVEHATRLLMALDDHLTADPVGGAGTFVATATCNRGAADRLALCQLARRCGAELRFLGPPADLIQPPRKRRLPTLEHVLLRLVALNHSAAQTCTIAGLEAGASAIELAHTRPADLRWAPGSGWQLAVPGSRDADPRILTLSPWAHRPAARLAASAPGGAWLLHSSISPDRDRRTSTLLMSVRAVLRACDLPWPGTTTAESIRRTSLTHTALHGGIDGWDRAIAAAGHRNPDVTDRLLRLAADW